MCTGITSQNILLHEYAPYRAKRQPFWGPGYSDQKKRRVIAVQSTLQEERSTVQELQYLNHYVARACWMPHAPLHCTSGALLAQQPGLSVARAADAAAIVICSRHFLPSEVVKGLRKYTPGTRRIRSIILGPRFQTSELHATRRADQWGKGYHELPLKHANRCCRASVKL